MNSKTYCRLPFKQITVSPTGRMQICCISDHNFTYKSDKRHINEFKNVDEAISQAEAELAVVEAQATELKADIAEYKKTLDLQG